MATVLVVGASRGIGLGLVQAYLARGDRVLATVRRTEDCARLRALGAEVWQVDVAQPSSVSGLAWMLDGEALDTAIYCAGVWDAMGADCPPSQPQFDHVMHTNVLGAMQVLPQIMPMVQPAQGVCACITSMLAQQAAAQPRAWLYSASKAALNMAVAAAHSQWPGATLVALDPGWVQTDMGGVDAPLSVHDCVQGLVQVLDRVTPGEGGQVLRHDGTRWR